MAPKIKICGITEAAGLEAAIAARADYAGLVFHAASPRHLALGAAAGLATQARGRIAVVALLVDPADDALAEVVAAVRPDIVQLHGAETPERVAAVRSRLGLPVWKAHPVAGPDDLDRARQWQGVADLVLLDAKTPKGALPGGMGLRFDWQMLAGRRLPFAWGLAGGLDPANVAEAIALTAAPLVDTSSGVERAPGVKNADLIAAFCSAARS